jgi:hypothetical protein
MSQEEHAEEREEDLSSMTDEQLDAALKGEEEAQQEAPEEEKPEEDGRPKMVPHQALHEERERRKAQERRTAEIERETQELRNWQRQMMERMTQSQQRQQEEEPSLDEDPIGRLDSQLAKILQRDQERTESERQRQQQEAVSQYVNTNVSQFRQQTPDYDNALQFLTDARSRELDAAGYTSTEIQQIINAEANSIVGRAIQNRANPAAMAYQMAVARGYQKPADETGKMATIAKGQETARTSGAGKAKQSLTPEDLLNMSDDEFDKHFDKVMRG